MCKKSFRLVTLALAVLLAAALLCVCGCGKKGGSGQYSGEIIEIGKDTSTEPPQEQGTESAAEFDPSVFDRPLSNLCALAAEPSFQKVRALMPPEYFDNLSGTLNQALEDAGMSIASLGYDSFDAFMEAGMGELYLDTIMDTSGIQHVESVDYKVLSFEAADLDSVRTAVADSLGDYIDVNGVTDAYRVSAAFTVKGDGVEKTNNADLRLYRFGGEYYIVFG